MKCNFGSLLERIVPEFKTMFVTDLSNQMEPCQIHFHGDLNETAVPSRTCGRVLHSMPWASI